MSLFVVLYLGDAKFVAAEAARQAGYSEKTAGQQGSRLLLHPEVREAINKALAEKEDLIKLRAARVAEETYGQAVIDMGDAYDSEGKLLPLGAGFKDAQGNDLRMPESIRRAIASVEYETRREGGGEDVEVYTVTKIKLHDKRASQELFLRYAGKLKDRLEMTGKDGGPVIVEVVEYTELE